VFIRGCRLVFGWSPVLSENPELLLDGRNIPRIGRSQHGSTRCFPGPNYLFQSQSRPRSLSISEGGTGFAVHVFLESGDVPFTAVFVAACSLILFTPYFRWVW